MPVDQMFNLNSEDKLDSYKTVLMLTKLIVNAACANKEMLGK